MACVFILVTSSHSLSKAVQTQCGLYAYLQYGKFSTLVKSPLSQLPNIPCNRQCHLFKMLATLFCRPILMLLISLCSFFSDTTKIRLGHVTRGIWVGAVTMPKIGSLNEDPPPRASYSRLRRCTITIWILDKSSLLPIGIDSRASEFDLELIGWYYISQGPNYRSIALYKCLQSIG